ncbi:LapA family protein [Paenalcaligenes niemegkensis]|uniref:LapA family protein n=1 Tax=Paenalcaligenes niemegkensis TaxID=2895469 RepID=UPI001EE95121|nr:LapA family protein [Paenalcaligenes niemegkensis]MCQ9616795.1 LapA family protein [Paenalcaligenes niemegkensis]
MRYLVWVLRLLVFVLVLLFALKNTEPVNVNFFADYGVANVPLVVVMLSALILGLVFGLLLMVGVLMRKRREIARLRRDVARLEESIRHPLSHTDTVAPETVAPLAPL